MHGAGEGGDISTMYLFSLVCDSLDSDFFLIPSICGHPDAAVAPRGSQGRDPEAPPWASPNHQETVKRGILDAFMEPQLGDSSPKLQGRFGVAPEPLHS